MESFRVVTNYQHKMIHRIKNQIREVNTCFAPYIILEDVERYANDLLNSCDKDEQKDLIKYCKQIIKACDLLRAI